MHEIDIIMFISVKAYYNTSKMILLHKIDVNIAQTLNYLVQPWTEVVYQIRE